MISEAKQQSNGNISLNGWAKGLVTAMWGLLVAIGLFIANVVVANDTTQNKEISENKNEIVALKVDYQVTMIQIKKDLDEIKKLLNRKNFNESKGN